MKEENIILLQDCNDGTLYGIIKSYNKTVKEFRDKIIDIKNDISDEGIIDWTIEDVFNRIPNDWDYDYINIEKVKYINI